MAKAAGDSRTVRIRLVCDQPPPEQDAFPGSEFGLQDKQEQLHPGELQPDGSLVFLFDLEVVSGQAQDAVRWRGPYVHGTAAAPFLYLGLRRAETASQWIKRINVPLAGITSRQIEAASKTNGSVLEGRVSGKGSGTVALLGDGWSVRSATD